LDCDEISQEQWLHIEGLKASFLQSGIERQIPTTLSASSLRGALPPLVPRRNWRRHPPLCYFSQASEEISSETKMGFGNACKVTAVFNLLLFVFFAPLCVVLFVLVLSSVFHYTL